MIVLSLEEFSARRRTAQQRIEDALRPMVERAVDHRLNTNGWAELIAEVAHQWQTAYAEESGHSGPRMEARFRAALLDTLAKTKGNDEATVDRITVWLATAILSHATLQASADDEEELFVEWVDMGDSKVREAHRHAAGQQRPIGEKFKVDGHEMAYPGDPTVPIELWINCRCTLRPVLASEVLTANIRVGQVATSNLYVPRLGDWPSGIFVSEKPWDGSASRFTPEQWKSSCILHVCDGPEKSCHKLPIKEPGGALSRAGVHAAAGRIGQVDAPPEKVASAKAALRGAYKQLGETPPDSLTATAEQRQASTVVVALPGTDSEVHDSGEEQKHVTLAFLGGFTGDAEEIAAAVAGVAGSMEPFTAAVSGTATLGPDKAQVWLVEAVELGIIRDRLLDNETLAMAVAEADAHPHFVPHMTIGYPDGGTEAPPEGAADITEIQFDRLAVWHGSDQTEYPLGEAMTESAPETEQAVESGLLPWHGVLAPEGIASGDGRKFAEGSLRVRPLPLPLTWQKTSADGHSGSVTVAKIDRIERVDGEMRGSGLILATAEADEVVGLLAEFGRFGVSVDADDASFEMNDETQEVVFTDARIASAAIVAIPAFAEAWVALGEAPEGFFPETDTVAVDDTTQPDEALVAAGAPVDVFVDVAPGVTEDGPGWLTHPVDTDRLRDYWVRGEGAAKIAWGVPGDFERCRVNLAKYVKPQYLNGYCANRHKDALGVWPGQEASASEVLTDTPAAEALSIVAASGLRAPHAWFENPNLDKPTAMTITEEGRVFGHIAAWNTCHSAWADQCVTAPRSPSNYAHFLLGEVLTDSGPVPVGNLTIGGGHAGPRLSMRAAMAHYDNTTAAWADVTVGEDSHGIWCAGWVRPGTPDEMVVAARASKLSGDWRQTPDGLDMCAALAVNVPGFRIPRIAAATSGTTQLSLVAAGVVVSESTGSSEIDLDALGAAVAMHLTGIAERKARIAALAARMEARV